MWKSDRRGEEGAEVGGDVAGDVILRSGLCLGVRGVMMMRGRRG